MESLIAAAGELQSFCRDRDWRYCFIGGLSVQKWGEPRLTRDVDLSLLSGFGQEAVYVLELLKYYEPRIPEAFEFGVRNRVVLLKSSSGIGIDIALAALPFEEQVIERAVDISFGKDVDLKICTAEDLIVFKAFANRGLDWHDIETILQKQGCASLDWGHIETMLRPLCQVKGSPEIVVRLMSMRAEAAP